MFKKLTALFALLFCVSGCATNTSSENTASASYKDYKTNVKPAHIVPIMDVVLNENLYVIQPQTSTVTFRVESPLGEVRASFQDFEGSFIMVDSSAHAEPVSIDIKTRSLDVDNTFIDLILKSEHFFDVTNFPSIHFEGSNFEWFNDTQAVLKGYMTIKNVTKQVAFYVELVNANAANRYSDHITVKATTTIRRSEFGIYTLLHDISDDVNLLISIDALKKETSIAMLENL